MSYGLNERVHSTAQVSSHALIGADTHVWAFASIGAGAIIGERCTIGQGVHIAPGVKVGNGCKIQNGAQLFTGVELEDDVFIGPHVVFTNVLTPRAAVSRKTKFQVTTVHRGVSIGANATVLCGLTIGEYALIGAGSVVTRSIPPHVVAYGNPAKDSDDYACVCGEILPRRFIGGNVTKTCECGERFELGDNRRIVRLGTTETPQRRALDRCTCGHVRGAHPGDKRCISGDLYGAARCNCEKWSPKGVNE